MKKIRLRPLQYGVTLLAVGLALLAAQRLRQVPGESRFGLFLVVVIVSSWRYGLGPGLFATALSSLALDYFFLSPTHSLSINAADDFVRLLAFLLVALLISSLNGVRHAERKRAETFAMAQKQLLKMIRAGVPLSEVLETLMHVVEAQAEGMLCSVLMLDEDGQHLRQGAGPSLPEAYNRAINGLSIGPQMGSCGPPDFRQQPVIAADVTSDPLWANVRDLATEYGLRACWSTPILSTQGNVLGRFAMYYRQPRSPSPSERELIEVAGNIAGIAIERHRPEEAQRRAEEKYRNIFENAAEGIFQTVPEGRYLSVNPALARMYGYERTEDLLAMVTNIDQQIYVDPNRSAEFKRLLEERGSVRDFESQTYRRDGRKIWTSANAHAVRDVKGTLLYYEGIVQDITERKRAEERLRRSREQLRSLSAHLQSVREEERTHIAREIHDELGQMLTGLKIDLSWLESRLGRNGHLKTQPLLLDKIKSMSNLVGSTIQTVRRISTELRPGVLDDLGLTAAIEWQGQEFQARTGIRCKFNCNVEEVKLDPDRSTAVFRIFQETLTNVARHANATQVEVHLIEEADDLLLRVNDNGRGITRDEISNSKSLGILGVRERVILLGGKIRIRGAPGKGTSLTLWVPLNKRNGG